MAISTVTEMVKLITSGKGVDHVVVNRLPSDGKLRPGCSLSISISDSESTFGNITDGTSTDCAFRLNLFAPGVNIPSFKQRAHILLRIEKN